jgi:prophage DNA circulation protein
MAELIPPGIGPLTQTAGNQYAIDQSNTTWLQSTWWQQLQPGSWRGVGFVMDAAELKTGRRVAMHEYPYRDTVWPEDLGRLPRRFSFQAFLVGDDVYQQRDAMVEACEQPGEGTLVHPTFGSVECVLVDFTTTDRRERGRMVEIAFSFVVSGDILFPTTALATGAQVGALAGGLNEASAADLYSRQAVIYRRGR